MPSGHESRSTIDFAGEGLTIKKEGVLGINFELNDLSYLSGKGVDIL